MRGFTRSAQQNRLTYFTGIGLRLYSSYIDLDITPRFISDNAFGRYAGYKWRHGQTGLFIGAYR